ncbi:MAG: glycosyltransferase family 4 protein [Cyclobacteriaceae bacterium]
MRLLYLSYSKIPSRFANSIQVMHMCHAFTQQGWSVNLFYLPTALKGDIGTYYGLPNTLVQLVPIRMPRVKVISRFLYALRVIWSIKRNGWKGLLYGRDFFSLALIAKTQLIREPIYLEIHQPPSDRLENYLQQTIFRSTQFKGLVVISEALKQEYERRFGKLVAGKIHVAHDAASPSKTISSVLPASDVPRVGYTGSLQPGKGMELIAKIAADLPECEFHIVGGTDEQVAYWSQQCPPHVYFHGHQDPQKIADYLASFDVVLAPYQPQVKVGHKKIDIARWMSPLKLFEYMAASKPIVASDLPVLREVLHHKQNALLINPDDIAAWVQAIRSLLEDEKLREQLSQQAHRDFHQHYTWEKRAEQLGQLFDTLHHQTTPAL